MRAVVQRVLSARVEVDGAVVGSVGRDLVAFIGAAHGDTDADLEYLVGKIVGLRVFADEAGKMSRALLDAGGGLLVVSQFTVFGDVRRGLRPSFDGAMEPRAAEAMLDDLVRRARGRGVHVETGRFGADMRVFVENDGPVTILLDSRRLF